MSRKSACLQMQEVKRYVQMLICRYISGKTRFVDVTREDDTLQLFCYIPAYLTGAFVTRAVHASLGSHLRDLPEDRGDRHAEGAVSSGRDGQVHVARPGL